MKKQMSNHNSFVRLMMLNQLLFQYFRWKKRRLKQNQAMNKLTRAEQEMQQEREEFE